MIRSLDLVAAGVLLDMDGTLVDSTAVVERLWTEFSAEHDLDAAAVLEFAHGRPTADTMAHFLPGESADTIRALADAVMEQELARSDGIVEVPGAGAFVAGLLDAGVPTALVTSAPRALALLRMRAAGVPVPSVLVTPGDAPRGKPAPDPYLAAADRLGVAAADCVVFEDAEAGIAAALAAGARVVVVGRFASPTTDGLDRIDGFAGVRITCAGPCAQ